MQGISFQLGGEFDRPNHGVDQLRVALVLILAMLATPLSAQEVLRVRGLWSTGNPFLDGLLLLCLLGFIWSLLYWGLYPRALREYGEDAARGIFWSGIWLYGTAALYLSQFLFFNFGYFFVPWAHGAILGLVLLLSVWFSVSWVSSRHRS